MMERKATPSFPTEHTLHDGTRVRIRPIGRADRDRYLAGFARLSDETRYRRFFTALPRMPEALVQRMLDTDGWNHLAIGAERIRADGSAEDAIVGVARFIRRRDDPQRAEAAVTVADELHHQGLGRILLAELGRAARARGVRRFEAQVLAGNAPMRALLGSFGAGRPRREDDRLVYEFAIARRAA
jgi:RimJ/RimL family protein N-acetyltransferase